MTAVRPRQFDSERAEDVVERLGNNDVVIDCHQTVQHHVADTDTYTTDRLSHSTTHARVEDSIDDCCPVN